MDFQDVVHWQNNKLDRTQNSRMGWTDLSICLSGPVVQDLKEHFAQRWNMIYDEKYRVRKDSRYSLLSASPVGQSAPSLVPPQQGYGQQPPSPGHQQGVSA
jgi:phospholipase D1/2